MKAKLADKVYCEAKAGVDDRALSPDLPCQPVLPALSYARGGGPALPDPL